MEQRLDQFMARANAAYYASADPLGGFTTAPEISQVFGELLGAWAAVVWKSMGRPRDIVLAELGPRHADGRCSSDNTTRCAKFSRCNSLGGELSNLTGLPSKTLAARLLACPDRYIAIQSSNFVGQ
jgi:hypothetical protein